jgi:hypothetical protein
MLFAVGTNLTMGQSGSVHSAKPLVVGPINGSVMTVAVDPQTMESMLMTRKEVELPDDLKDVEGTVMLDALIDATGHVLELKTIAGDARPQPYVMQAVRERTYRQYALNGRPA